MGLQRSSFEQKILFLKLKPYRASCYKIKKIAVFLKKRDFAFSTVANSNFRNFYILGFWRFRRLPVGHDKTLYPYQTQPSPQDGSNFSPIFNKFYEENRLKLAQDREKLKVRRLGQKLFLTHINRFIKNQGIITRAH